MEENELLQRVKMSLRVKTDAFDEIELKQLICSAKLDLGIAGVVLPFELDAIVIQAIVTYCKMNFGSPEEYDKLKASYDEQKAQLSMATGYTVWTSQT